MPPPAAWRRRERRSQGMNFGMLVDAMEEIVGGKLTYEASVSLWCNSGVLWPK